MKAESDEHKPRRSTYAVAVALLAMREHSRAELSRKLRQRQHADDEIQAALDSLSESGLLSDTRAARAQIRSGIRRGHGPERIRQSLHRAGLESMDQILNEDDEVIDWTDQARELSERKFGNHAPTDYFDWARRARFLQSRGYDGETIRKALGAIPR